MLLFGVWAGSLADRFNKRRILIWSNAAYGILAAVEFALVATGAIRIWMVFVIAFLYGLVIAIEPPTRQSFYAELVGEEHITNAVSLNSAVFTGTRVLGGALAGMMIHEFGLWSPYLFDTVSYAAAIWALLAMRPGELHRFDRADHEPGLVRAGLRYVWRSTELRVPLLVMCAVYLFTFNFSVLIPLHAARTYGGSAREIGWLYAAVGLGAFLGSIGMANRQPDPTRSRLAACAVAFGTALGVAGVVPTFSAALGAMVLVGLASMLFAITANSTLQRWTRADMRGRVMSLYTTIFLGSTAIGGPITGWAAERLGVWVAFVASGAVAVAAGLWAFRGHDPLRDGEVSATEGTAARSA